MSGGIFDPITGYHNRRSVRLRGYDYSKPGYYFITICIHDRLQHLFGDVVDGKMVENQYGKIVRDEWHKTAVVRPYVLLDEFSIMPNHLHGIIHLTIHRGTARRAPGDTAEQFGKPTVGTIPTIVRAFKSAIAKRIHETKPEFRWQRNYYLQIIRDEKSLFFIRKYIRENPARWNNDSENGILLKMNKLQIS